jgi:hypothetical protein
MERGLRRQGYALHGKGDLEIAPPNLVAIRACGRTRRLGHSEFHLSFRTGRSGLFEGSGVAKAMPGHVKEKHCVRALGLNFETARQRFENKRRVQKGPVASR